MQKSFFGYRRDNGRGIRNHVLILPLTTFPSLACNAVGLITSWRYRYIQHPYGRLRCPVPTFDLHFRIF